MTILADAWNDLDRAIVRTLTSTMENVSVRALSLDSLRLEMGKAVQGHLSQRDPAVLSDPLIGEALRVYVTKLFEDARIAMNNGAARPYVDSYDDKRVKVQALMRELGFD